MTERALLHHRVDGPKGAPALGTPLFLGPSIGTSLRVWEPLTRLLTHEGRTLIRYDLPGHGGTPTAVLPNADAGATTMADLAGLVLDLADALDIATFDYAGISLGGAIGSWLAVHHPDRVSRLIPICSSARFGESGAWRERAASVRREGTAFLLDLSAARWFTEPYRTGGSTLAAALVDDLRRADPTGYAACCDALAGFDLRDDLGKIVAPTLVVVGRDDPATPPAHSRLLADAIPGAALLEVPHAAHLAPVEQPARIGEAMCAHLAAPEHPGTAVRRAVLGDAYVDRAIAHTTSFTADFQDLVTRYAWGGIWTRPGLERRMRSAVTLTALVAHGHHSELAMHLRGALNNGLTRDEIKEILLQSAVYCGVPAANAAFAVAQRFFDELDHE
jgi:3-oxoadipate enol-lactonase/4-carboxymuconolactone decarboxylase